MNIYTKVAKLFPRKIRQRFSQSLVYAGINLEPMRFLGFVLAFGLIFSIISGYILNSLKILPFLLGVIASFIIVEVAFYLRITLSVDSKAKFVESVLPDALQLMSSNIRAGLTTDKALLLAARPEFGPLADEIKRIGRETMTSGDLTTSLMKTTKRIKSENLKKTIDLIVNSIKSGGKLADLLDQTANDLREQQMIQKEISASVLMYAIFIFIAIGMGAPLLFAMSSFLVRILVKMGTTIRTELPSGSEEIKMPISMTSSGISSEFIGMFAIVSLIISSVFGSMIIGLILKGNARSGIKYLLILLPLSIALFFLGSYAMDTFLGGMMK